MQATDFYTTDKSKCCPLYLLSQEKWQQEIAPTLSSQEKAYLSQQSFNGNCGELGIIYTAEGQIDKIFLGTGKGENISALYQALPKLPPLSYEVKNTLSFTEKVAFGLGQYAFTAYKKQSEKERNFPKLIISKEESFAIFEEVSATFLIRDLINTPTNHMGPEELSLILENLASEHQATFKQWVDKELLTENFPAIHAVGRASAAVPRLLSLRWGNPQDPHLVLIGKGVCFDSGGLDLKPGPYMRTMKKDMAGAAHVIGLARFIMRHQLPVYLEVLIPAVENAVGPQSFRPGDILTMRNGCTVEVDNTDAEGRLILADALSKACEDEDKPALLMTFATLTGAARVAVGTEIAALFTNKNNLAQALIDKGEENQDPICRLPLFAGYKSLLNSSIAELSNCHNSPYGGAITAALFLEHFIPDDIPWAHFDIMAWNTSAKPGKPEGGEAMGFRAVAHYLLATFPKAK